MDSELTREGDFPIKPGAGEPVTPGLQILVVDDDKDGRETLATLLGMHGYSVRIASDGLQALQEVEVALPDVVLLDIGLPRINGFEVARQLREQQVRKRPFIIAVTGYGQEEHVRRSQEAGIDHHLLKPVQIGELLALLTNLQRIAPPLP